MTEFGHLLKLSCAEGYAWWYLLIMVEPVQQPFSNLAKKYGENQSLPHLKFTGRSGLTPVLHPDYHYPPLSGRSRRQINGELQFQRHHLYNYSSMELDFIGGFTKSNPRPNNLDNPVHPIFQRSRWEVHSTIAIGNGHNGTWTAYNETVWRILVPSLRLASLFIANSHCWPW